MKYSTFQVLCLQDIAEFHSKDICGEFEAIKITHNDDNENLRERAYLSISPVNEVSIN